jgi:hypothetical protein
MTDRRDRVFFAALALITVAYLALFGYYLGATGLRVPVFDVIYWVLHYIDHWLTGDWWGYLWIPHNEHRLIWSRLLMIADLEWFGGNAMPFLLFGIACLFVLVGAIVQEVLASDNASEPRAVVALIVVLLLATSFNGIDCSAPQLGVYLHTSAFLVLALVLFDGRDEGGRHATVRRFGALVAAVCAAFGVSGGLLVWPILHWAVWRGGLGLRWIAIVWLVGVPLIVVYVHGLDARSVASSFDVVTLLRIADYGLRFLGLPWSHSPHLVNFGRAVGLATFGFGAYAILRFGILQPPRGRLDRISVGLLMFGFMTMAVIAISRVNTAPDREMPIRYALFTSLIQVALLLIAAPWFARIWAGHRRRAAQAIILLGAAVLFGQQILAGRAGAEGVAQYTAAYRGFEAGEWTQNQVTMVGFDRKSVERAVAFVHAHGLYRAER